MSNTAEPKSRNRRQSARRQVRRYVNVQCRKGAHGLGPNLATMVVDISTTGMCLVINQTLDLLAEVEILIDGYGLGRPIKRKGNVRWQVEIGSGHFGTGIEFQKRIEYHHWNALASPD